MLRTEDMKTQSAYFDKELANGVQTHQPPASDLQTSTRRRRNEHCSPIYTIPLEVLTTILLMSCACERASWEMFDEQATDPQVRAVSSVSSYWREVVVQTPRFWKSVTITVYGPRPLEVVTGTARLQCCFDRARNLGDLSVDLLLNRKTSALCQPISNILFTPDNAWSVTTLRIRYIPVEWLAELPELPRLHTLVLEDLQNEKDTPIIFNLAQPLRRLCLAFYQSEIQWGSINLPFSVEELLVYGAIAPHILLALLRQCPNLTKVDHWNDPSLFATPTPVIDTSITLDHLETLSLAVGNSLDPTSIPKITFPALRHLDLECGDEASPILVIKFCHRFSETLKSLEFHQMPQDWGTSDFGWLFLHGMERLETLTLTNWTLPYFIMAIHALTPSDEEFHGNKVKCLPRLQSLVLTAAPWSDDYDDPFGSAIMLLPNSDHSSDPADNLLDLVLGFIEKRRAGEVTRFRLDLPMLNFDCLDSMWLEGRQDRLRRVVKGRCIEVLQDGKVLEWL